MRLSRYLVPVAAFLIAAVLSGLGARIAVSAVEDSSAAGVASALQLEGIEWATVVANGLQVILEGEAPSEPHAGRQRITRWRDCRKKDPSLVANYWISPFRVRG